MGSARATKRRAPPQFSDLAKASAACDDRAEITCEPASPLSELLAEYVRTADLAHGFGKSERTIERWVRLRLLPQPIRLGRTRIFHIPSVRQHLAKRAALPKTRRQR
jgi:predicted DNA-binding transcriptional regulator AlpA